MSWSETAFVGRNTVCCINQNSIFKNIFDGGCFLFKYSFCLCKRISFGLYIPTSQEYLKALFTFSSGNCFKPCTKPSKPDTLRAEKGLDSPQQSPKQQFSLGWPFCWWKVSNLSSPMTVQFFCWVGAGVLAVGTPSCRLHRPGSSVHGAVLKSFGVGAVVTLVTICGLYWVKVIFKTCSASLLLVSLGIHLLFCIL